MIEEQTKPDIAEQYSSAVGTSNLRVDGQRRTPADMVIAAGMNEHRLGMSLRRLATEWDAVGKPPKASPENLEAMAAKYPREENGMVIYHGKEVTPAMAAHREAAAWHAHEMGLLFQRLKTLPEVRAALVHWATEKGMEGPEHVVGAVLQWWLSPLCPVCHGVKKKIIAGTGRTSSKDCYECKGSGEKKVPHGADGRRVAGHIKGCLNSAVAGLRRKFKHQA
jgi:hypothetical protein